MGEGGGKGLMLALILVTHLVDGNMQKRDQEIVTIDFNSPGPEKKKKKDFIY